MVNRYGLDTDYIRKNLNVLLRDIGNYRPEEMRRALNRLAETCKPENTCPECKSKKTMIIDADRNQCGDCRHIYSVC